MNRFFRWHNLFILAVCAGLLTAWRTASSHATPREPELSKIPLAAAVRVSREDLTDDLANDAELRPWQEIELHARVSGYLEQINVDIGDMVQTGQLLATIEVPELKDDIARSEALVRRDKEEGERARAAYEDARLCLTRLQGVIKGRPNLVAPQELDNATEKERTAASTLAAAEAQVEVAKAELNKLRTMDSYCRITAPFSGVITERSVDPGALIQAGTSSSGAGASLVRLSQTDKLRLDIPVSVSYAARVQPGAAVEVRIAALDQAITTVVARTSKRLDTATRTMRVEVDVPNPKLELLPGMYAAASLRLETRPGTLVLPIEAVSRGHAASVLLIGKDNKLEERPVTIGLETPTKLEVLSGVRENDLVLVGNRSQFRQGQQVQPKLLTVAEARP